MNQDAEQLGRRLGEESIKRASAKRELELVRGDGTDRLLTVLYGESSAQTIRHAIGGSEARMLTDAAKEIVRLREVGQENAQLRNLCRGLEAARDERDAFERDLNEIGAALGCGHIEDGLARCASEVIENSAGVVAAARALWADRDAGPQDQAAVRRLYNAWRALGVALAHLDGRQHISEA